MKDESDSQEPTNELPISRGYVEARHMRLDYSTIMIAQKVGILDKLVKCVKNFHTCLEQLGIKENNYEEMAKIIGVLQDVCRPIQKSFHTPNIVIGSFISPDTDALNTIYLTEYRIVLETADQIKGREIRDADPSEIWRYLYPPSKVLENIVSTIIAVAEKHKSIKDDYILSFQKLKELCLGALK